MPLPIPQIRPISDLRTNLNDVCELARESQQPHLHDEERQGESRGYRLRSVRRAAATRTLCAETPRSRNRGEISIGIAHETGSRRFHRAPFRTLGRLDACSPLPSSRCIRFRIDSDLSRRGAESPEISPQSLRFNRQINRSPLRNARAWPSLRRRKTFSPRVPIMACQSLPHFLFFQQREPYRMANHTHSPRYR